MKLLKKAETNEITGTGRALATDRARVEGALSDVVN